MTTTLKPFSCSNSCICHSVFIVLPLIFETHKHQHDVKQFLKFINHNGVRFEYNHGEDNEFVTGLYAWSVYKMLPLPKWSCFMLFICVLQISIKGYHCSPVRQKRNLLQLFDMVLKDTDKNPLDFIDYGCWCGLGGSGEPVDDIDRCCQQHDLCYGEVEKEFKVDPKMESYDWKSGDMIQCRNQEETCKYKTCMCDRALSQCFNQYPANPHQGKKNRHC